MYVHVFVLYFCMYMTCLCMHLVYMFFCLLNCMYFSAAKSVSQLICTTYMQYAHLHTHTYKNKILIHTHTCKNTCKYMQSKQGHKYANVAYKVIYVQVWVHMFATCVAIKFNPYCMYCMYVYTCMLHVYVLISIHTCMY